MSKKDKLNNALSLFNEVLSENLNDIRLVEAMDLILDVEQELD